MRTPLTNVRVGYAEFTHADSTYTAMRIDSSDGPVWVVYASATPAGERPVVIWGRKRRKDAVADAIEALTVAEREAAYDPSKTYVTVGDWCVSGTGGPDGYELNIYTYDNDAPNDMGGKGVIIRHPDHDGLHFPTWHDAQRHAYAYGFLQEYTRPFRTAA